MKITPIAILAISPTLLCAEVSLTTEWASQYMEQGLATTDDSFYSVALETSWEELTLGLFAGYASKPDFQEYHARLSYSTEISDALGFEIGYTHFQYPEDDAHTNELDATLAYALSEHVEAYVSATYNLDSDGIYLESGISASQQLSENLVFTPYALVGYTLDFTIDDLNAWNHLQIGAEYAYTLSDSTSLYASLHHTFSLAANERSGQEDTTWAVIGLNWGL